MKKEINLLKKKFQRKIYFLKKITKIKSKKNKLKNEIFSRKKKKNNLNKRI